MTKIDLNKILTRVNALCWTFLTAVFILKLFGIDVFVSQYDSVRVLEIVAFVDNNNYIRFILNVLMSLISMNLMYACVIDDYSKHIKPLSVFILSYSIGMNYFHLTNTYHYSLNIIAFSMYFIPCIMTNKLRTSLIIMLVDTLFVFLSATIIVEDLTEVNYSFIHSLIYSIDFYLMWGITYLGKRRRVYCNYLVGAQDLWAKLKLDCRLELKSMKDILKRLATKMNYQSFKQKSTKLKLTLKIYIKLDLVDDLKEKAVPVVTVFAIYTAYSFIIERTIEALFLYFAYLAIRKMFPKHFHADYIPSIKQELISVVCVALTTLTLCTALYAATGISFSIFTTILVALFVDFILFVFRDWLDLRRKYDDDFAKYGLSTEKAKFAYDYKIKGLSIKEQMLVTGLTDQVVRNYRSDVNRAIKNFNK